LLALRKRKPQETQALALASSQSWLPLLRPSIDICWRLRLLRENFTQQTITICYEFSWLHFSQKLLKSAHAQQSYRKNKKGIVF